MPSIEYFYSAHSAFANLGSRKLMQIAKDAGRTILHRPVDLRQVVDAVGAQSFADRSTAHLDCYSRREIERWSEYRDAPVMAGRPTHHDNETFLPNSLLIAGAENGCNIDRLAHAMLEAHWRDNANLTDRVTLVRLAQEVGLDPEPLLQVALNPEIQAIFDANTKEAIERSVF